MRLRALLLSIPLLLSACASDVRRGGAQINYADVDHPLSDTAVFSALAEQVNGLGLIRLVDGKPTGDWKSGMPGCVRVLPGTHTFSIKYRVFDGGVASYREGDTDATVENMKAQHVYVARYIVVDKKLSVAVTDVGNRPNFRTELGLKGVNFTCGEPIEFQ